MRTRAERVALIEELQRVRGGTIVLVYITNTRPGAQYSMDLEAIPRIHRHLKRLVKPGSKPKIDIFIHSDGGDGMVPWRLVTLIREHCAELTLLVPHRAFSAATLLALGCDRVIMGPLGSLGPTDVTIRHPSSPDPISVEDVNSYIAFAKEDVGIRHEDELIQAFNVLAQRVGPLAVGSVKRIASQSKLVGAKLLNQRVGDPKLDDHDVNELVDKLTSRLYFHGHSIGRGEAKNDLKLPFVENATNQESQAMWDLYEAYSEEMLLEEDFDYLLEAMGSTPPVIPDPPKLVKGQLQERPPTVVTRSLRPVVASMIESTARLDRKTHRFDVTLTRDWKGLIESSGGMIVAEAWDVEETPDGSTRPRARPASPASAPAASPPRRRARSGAGQRPKGG